MSQWIVVSIVLSIVLTVVINLALWLFPGAGRRIADGLGRLADNADRTADDRRGSHVRVIVPWKAMLIGSIVLTLALNLLVLLAR
jgi:uncharacterized protein YjeT (DUF2065 family)